jgi:hypothetical protein
MLEAGPEGWRDIRADKYSRGSRINPGLDKIAKC